jgi:hypothetical protein
MRKISNTRDGSRSAWDQENLDHRPRCIPGATITSWHGSPEIDLSVLFASPPTGTTVAGSASATSYRPERSTVSLSDGTKITFANSSHSNAAASV